MSMYYFVELSCVIAEVWMTYLLLSSMYIRKKQPWWYALLICGAAGSALAIFSFLEGMAFARIGFSLLLFWLIGIVLFQVSTVRSFLSALIMCTLAALADILISILLGAFGFDLPKLMEQGNIRQVFLIAAHVLMLGLVLCVMALAPKSAEKISLKILAPILPCWSVSAFLCLLLAWQMLSTDLAVPAFYLLVLMGMLYTNFFVIYCVNKISVQDQKRHEQELAEHHYAMQQEYYEQFRIQQEEIRALWHDIRKYLRAARAEGSSKALQQVEEMLDGICCVVDVENRVVSVILNEYAQAAKDNSIRLNLDVQVPPELFVTAADLYVLIGNTMDNAIDACTELPEEQRYISLKLKLHNNMLFLEIKNPFVPDHLNRVRGKMHGYGLKNVQQCVERYNGTLEVHSEGGVFQVVAHLNSV